MAAGHDVTLLGRPALADAVAADGLRVTGLTAAAVRPRVITAPEGEYDVVMLTCKAHQTAALGAVVAPLVAPGGCLASMQNGLGNAEKLARFVPAERLVACLTSHGVTMESPGRLRHAGAGITKVGPAPSSTDDEAAAARVVAGLLDEAGLEPVWCDAMRGHIWHKAIINAGINPVAALHGVKNGALLEGGLARLSAHLVTEAVDLAVRARVELPDEDLVATLRNVCKTTAQNKCSMLQDIEAGRVTEIEQINGRMVRLAEALLVPVPRNESIYGRVKDLEAEQAGIDASRQAAWEETQHLSDLV